MAVDNPWAIDGLPLTALAWRRAMSGLLLRSGDTVSAVAGVLTGCGVTVAGSNATVAAGQVVVTPAAGDNGSYIVGLTSTVLALTARDATYGRIDRVAIRVWDNSVDGLGQDKADAIIVTGTPAASPVAPALPAGVHELAQLQVPNAAGGAVTVVDRRRRTTANGGVPWFPDTGTRDVVLPAPQPGQMCVTGTATNQVVWVWTGSAWLTLWAPLASVPLTISVGTANYAPTAYRDGDGWVSLDGAIGQGSMAPGAWTVVTTLPVGFRPSKYQYYPTALPSAVTSTPGCGIRIQLNGNVECMFGANSSAVLPLTNVRFRVA